MHKVEGTQTVSSGAFSNDIGKQWQKSDQLIAENKRAMGDDKRNMAREQLKCNLGKTKQVKRGKIQCYLEPFVL